MLYNIKNPNELLKYMEKNIKYGFIGKNGKIYDDPKSEEWNDWYNECVVQDAEGIIRSGYGTCWDQVELERKWFSNNGYNFKTIYIQFEVGMDRMMPTHTFLIFESNNKWYWFEHSFEKNKGIHEFDSVSDVIEYVKDRQLDYVMEIGIGTKHDREFIIDYEYSKPERNINVPDYLNHVTSKKYTK